MYSIEQNSAVIDEVLNRCAEQEEEGGSAVPGMSYESGVKAGIEWLTTKGASHSLE